VQQEERPLAIDLFTGLHGWGAGLVAEGFRVVGFDLEDMCGQLP
jgi:site-specific DNA-cytosine methylase